MQSKYDALLTDMAGSRHNSIRMPGIGAIALVFGLLTIAAGGGVLFGPIELSSLAGNTVTFVLWFNFLAGFVYLAAAYGFWKGEDWALRLTGLLVFASAAVFVMLLVYIVEGNTYEVRTPLAMGFRLLVWTLIYLYARVKLQQLEHAKLN